MTKPRRRSRLLEKKTSSFEIRFTESVVKSSNFVDCDGAPANNIVSEDDIRKYCNDQEALTKAPSLYEYSQL